ncbi:rap guanine nucleotide exchange factor 1-like isoform X5 [Acipenser ruthenus]|uniref:rap guanine nucleotide exchange factor 1-like isoform X5 n=1 Tax=Acipenser ruthenus TaxID=7906 RepID=UPI00274291DA|nr:rap guanine nucleotide exchange factor 1-like isoform X5 [Acipenser ruthenus]
MSGKIEKQDSQRSHLTSFTMKLMDKFHSPKIKRTPSKKGKQQQPEPTVKAAEKPVNKNVSRLEEHEKEVVSALRYFKTIVDKMVADKRVLEMLPGSASKVLEAILPLVQVEPRIQQSRVTGGSAEHIKPFSSAVSSCHNRVYQSLANLIRWSDQVMLEGVNLDDKETVLTVTVVIKAVLDGVKELVKLTIEKQEHPSPASPASPVKQISPACKSEITTELPLTEREKEILHKTTPMTRSLEILPDAAEEDVAPPKPPLPGIKVNEHSPPALPPKKRQSAPSPTRVAVVAPMSRTTSGSSLPIGISKQEYDQDCLQRRLSSGSRSYGGESPRLSPCNSIGKLSKSDEQLSSLQHDSGQCSRNTSCETLDNTENYDPDYDFLHQDLSNADQVPHTVPSGVLSPLPESHSESPSHFPGQPFRIASPQPLEYCRSLGSGASPQPTPVEIPPALPQKKRRSAASLQSEGLGSRVSYERHPSQYDNISEDDLPVPPFPVFAAVSPLPQGIATIFSADFNTSVTDDIPESPPPLPEKKSKHIQQYMQFLEDYSEPQPSVFYQTPQSESIYEQRNKRFQEAYGFNDSFSSTDSVHELLPPPRLPPKQRQLASYNASSSSSSSSSSLSCHVQHAQAVVPVEDANAALSLSMSVSNSFLSRHSSFTAPSDPAAVTDDALPDPSPQKPSTNSKENAEDGSRRQKSTDSDHSDEEVDELSLIDHKEIMTRITLKQEVRDRVCASDQDLSAIIEHVEPSLRSDDGPDVRAGSGDILLVHATETDRKDLVLYCEAFLTTYRTFITPEDLIKKLHYRYTRFCHSPDTFKKRVSKNTFFVLVRVVDELCLVELTDDILKQLMDLVFRLVCSGELSLARVLRKNILDKVDQKKQLRYINSMKPLAARGVAARPGTLHDFRSHEIADQLTLLDAELFYKIEIPEVLLWAKEQNEEKSPNLTQFTEHFNNMSYWVRSIIILQEKAQDREKLLLKFIKIMKHLRKLNNFNSYLAILSALDSAPIRRLEWQKQTSEGLEEYCTLIDSSSSFRAYRAALAEVEPPCIPYLGLILQDLTFVHLGNPDLIDGKVNFSKRWQQFNILDSMRRFQQVHYELKRNDDIVSFFNDFSDHLAEEALWELSLKIKPRNITRRKTEREEKT